MGWLARKMLRPLTKSDHQRFGSRIVLVTHDESIASSGTRRITLRDPRIVKELRQCYYDAI